MSDYEWAQELLMPALLRHARVTYGRAMRKALAEAGYDDLPANGLYIIGALQLDLVGFKQIISELHISKQAAGQLVDTLVTRGYLSRSVDPDDRRRMNIALTERGADAAKVQAAARNKVDEALIDAVGEQDVRAARRTLGALIDLVDEDD